MSYDSSKISSRTQILLCIQRPINAMLVNSPMYKYIDGSCYIVQNHRYQEALERLGGVGLYKNELHDIMHVIHKNVDANKQRGS